jgi:hypothetical protein
MCGAREVAAGAVGNGRRMSSRSRGVFGARVRLRLKRLPSNAARSVPSIKIPDRVPRYCSCASFRGAFCFASLSAKKYGIPSFQLESELQNIPEAAPEASPSFSVSEELARYGSSALTGVEHLTLLLVKGPSLLP